MTYCNFVFSRDMQRGCRWRPTRRSSWRTWRATRTWPLRTSSCGTPAALRSTIVYSLFIWLDTVQYCTFTTTLNTRNTVVTFNGIPTLICCVRTPTGHRSACATRRRCRRISTLIRPSATTTCGRSLSECRATPRSLTARPAVRAFISEWAQTQRITRAHIHTHSHNTRAATWLIYRSKCFLKVRALISQLQSLSNLHILLTRILLISFNNFQALN